MASISISFEGSAKVFVDGVEAGDFVGSFSGSYEKHVEVRALGVDGGVNPEYTDSQQGAE